jgi:hypothetical protein
MNGTPTNPEWIILFYFSTTIGMGWTNGFELSGQGYDHSVSIRRASLFRCSEWLCIVNQ